MIELDVWFMTRRFDFHNVISNYNNQIWIFVSAEVSVEILIDDEQFLHVRLWCLEWLEPCLATYVYAKCSIGD